MSHEPQSPSGNVSSKQQDDVDRETFDYLMKNDIPVLMDTICRHVMRVKPKRPIQSIINFLNAKHGNHHGGLAIAGQNAGGGWLRILDCTGNLTGSVDRLPFRSEGYLQLIAAAPRERTVYVATVTLPTDGDEIGSSTTSMALADDDSGERPLTTISRYSFEGQSLGAWTVSRSISAMTVDREKGHLWVAFKAGGGVVLQPNGAKIRDLSLPPAQGLILAEDGTLWLLGSKVIEKRDADTGSLELAVHLPDSMLTPTSFVLSGRHIWCAAANSDGSANFVGGFDFTGRGIANFVPPPGSMLCYDRLKGGLWHLSRHCTKGTLSFTNERGTRIMSLEVGKSLKNNIAVDYGSGMLWHYRESDSGDARLGLYDPIKGSFATDVEAPLSKGPTTHMLVL